MQLFFFQLCYLSIKYFSITYYEKMKIHHNLCPVQFSSCIFSWTWGTQAHLYSPRKSRETIPLFQPVCWMWNRLMAILIHTRLENGNINPSKGLSNMTVSGLPTPRERVLAGKSSLISLLSLCLSVLGPLILVSCGLQGLARNTSSPGKNAV